MKTIEQVREFIKELQCENSEARDRKPNTSRIIYLAKGALQMGKEILDFIDSGEPHENY